MKGLLRQNPLRTDLRAFRIFKSKIERCHGAKLFTLKNSLHQSKGFRQSAQKVTFEKNIYLAC